MATSSSDYYDRQTNTMDQRWVREATHVRKEQVKSMELDKWSYMLPHIYDKLFIVATSTAATTEVYYYYDYDKVNVNINRIFI